MKTTYELTSEARKGSIKATYEDGLLMAVEIDFKPPLSIQKTAWIFGTLPTHVEQVEDFNYVKEFGLKISKVMQPNEKIALFCRIYEKHKGIKYKVSAADSGKIKQIDPSEELLHFYFRSENFLFKGKQSIANLVKYWNELRADFAGKDSGTTFPNDWQPELVKKLTPQQTVNYYAHLRSLGMQMIKSQTGQVVGFK